MEPENFEKRKNHEILTLVTSEAIVFHEFSSLTRISLPCGVALAKGRGRRGAGMKFISANIT